MNIRKATPEDIECIGKIHALSWKSAYRNIVPQAYLNRLQGDFWTDAFSCWLTNRSPSICLASDGGAPVGCVVYGKSQDGGFADWGEIFSLYLLPTHLSKGYGKLLLNRALSDLRKNAFQRVFLWVLEQNLRARTFYEAIGFTCTDDRCHVEMMEKRLIQARYAYYWDAII